MSIGLRVWVPCHHPCPSNATRACDCLKIGDEVVGKWNAVRNMPSNCLAQRVADSIKPPCRHQSL